MGGAAIVYLSNLMLRFDDKSKLKADEGLGISGSLVDITFVKSRNNKAGTVATLVFNQEIGYDEELSEYLLLKNNNRINGAGAFLYVGSHSEIKFAQKNFREKLHTDPEFAKIFYGEVMDVLKSMLTDPYKDIDSNNFDIAADIMSMIRKEEGLDCA